MLVVSKVADPAARSFLMSVHTNQAREARYVREGLEREATMRP